MKHYRRKRGGKRTYLNRSGWSNKHHLRAKSLGGTDDLSNLIRLDDMRHAAWHLLWGNKTIGEIIAILKRVADIKEKLG